VVNADVLAPRGVSVLYVEVAGDGGAGGPFTGHGDGGAPGVGGGNGGGSGFAGGGGGSGGASDVRTCAVVSCSLTTFGTGDDPRLVVAGGGGGGGGNAGAGTGGAAGTGGGAAVAAGTVFAGASGGNGTETGGGGGGSGGGSPGGTGSDAGGAGAAGSGGFGGTFPLGQGGGGAGGGGFFGGGGGGGSARGSGGGGGGGSSFARSCASHQATTYLDITGKPACQAAASLDTTGHATVTVSYRRDFPFSLCDILPLICSLGSPGGAAAASFRNDTTLLGALPAPLSGGCGQSEPGRVSTAGPA
jgi:hypothetical protein